jgi:hypothetical protein
MAAAGNQRAQSPLRSEHERVINQEDDSMSKPIATIALSLLAACAVPAFAQPAEGGDQAAKTINTYV